MLYEEPLTRRPIGTFPRHPESVEMECGNEDSDDEDDLSDDIDNEKSNLLKYRKKPTYQKLYPDIPIERDCQPHREGKDYQPKTFFKDSFKTFFSKNTTNNETKPTSHTNEESKVNIYNVILSIIVAFLCYFIINLYISYIYGNHTLLSSFGKQEVSDASKIVNTLKSDFAHQPELSLRIVRESLKKVINSRVPEPAILLLLSSKRARAVGICFAVQLARLISKSENNFLEINGESLMNAEPNKAKVEIDNNITRAFEIDGQTVVLFKHLDMVPSPAAMMLHSYCDHENAPFKKVVFILTISTEEDILENADSKAFDSLANSRLISVWADLHHDQLYAFLSRITVSVAAIFPDDLPSNCSFLR